jgi:hypothetical protein
VQHLYPMLGAGGLVLAFALRAFLKLARLIIITALAVAVVAAVHSGVVP